jgi:hypothetical protein
MNFTFQLQHFHKRFSSIIMGSKVNVDIQVMAKGKL